MKYFVVLFMFLLLPFIVVSNADAKLKANKKAKPDTPPYEVVSEYIRSLSAIHSLQLTASADNASVDDNEVVQKFMNAVRDGKLFEYELKTKHSAIKKDDNKKERV